MAREKPIYHVSLSNATHDYETTSFNNDDDHDDEGKAQNTPLTLLGIDRKV